MRVHLADSRRERSRRRAFSVLAALVVLTACDESRVRETLPPGVRADTYVQSAVAKVDVLVVVDDSPSMVEEQENLGQNFDRFLTFLTDSEVDFHIGVTTTDIVNDKGKLRNAEGHPTVITPRTTNPLASFAANVRVATQGNARESGLDAARRTFELNPEGFLRTDAWLFIIFVSDEEDSSFGTPKFFYRYFASLKGKGNESMVKAGAIVGDVPDGCVSEQGAADPGARYVEVVNLLGGRVGSICDAKFDRILMEMGLDAVGLKRKFPLSKVPDLETLEVRVDLACGVSTELTNTICASVIDDCSSGGQLRCTVKPTDGSDGWSYEPGTQTVVFEGRALPPKGARIEFIYFEPDSGGA